LISQPLAYARGSGAGLRCSDLRLIVHLSVFLWQSSFAEW